MTEEKFFVNISCNRGMQNGRHMQRNRVPLGLVEVNCKNMVWLNPNDYEEQEYVELRLNAPKDERIFLEFNPLKTSDEPDWNPMWEEWHCYSSPLRIYKQDYELLIAYFNKIYPVRDGFDGTFAQAFDVCFGDWIEKSDWLRIIYEIEQDLNCVCDGEKLFLIDFLEWLKEALKHTSIIVVEGNL